MVKKWDEAGAFPPSFTPPRIKSHPSIQQYPSVQPQPSERVVSSLPLANRLSCAASCNTVNYPIRVVAEEKAESE
jgi:hypothetical protein